MITSGGPSLHERDPRSAETVMEVLDGLLFGTEPIARVQGWIGRGYPLPFRIASLLGDTWGIVWVAGVSLWLFGRRTSHAVAGIVVAGALTKVVFSSLFEHARPRGPDIVVYDRLDLSSFPSGHVYEAVGPWGLLYALGQLPLWVPALVALLVGVGRLYLGAHFLGDVLAGIVLGVLLVWGFVRVWPAVHRWLSRRGVLFYSLLGIAAVGAAAARLPVYGSDLRRYEVLGLVVGASLAMPGQARLPPGERWTAGRARLLTFGLGSAGVAGLLLAARVLAPGAALAAGVAAALATLWSLLLAPLVVSRRLRGSDPPGDRPRPDGGEKGDRRRIPEPPRGWARVAWLGPGFLWMVSAAGSGELLFTPRVGALYGYALLWALLAAVVLKWFVNREIGRFTVCTGASLLEGFHRLPGPRDWAVWLLLVPQAVVAVATIAGLAGSAATALLLVLPGDVRIWMIGSVLASTALVLWGRYRGVERVATVIAALLGVSSVAAAITISPPLERIASGLAPRLPPEVDYAEILPWLGFMLSGAAGMVWYSYWLRSKGYGAAGEGSDEPIDPRSLGEGERARLRGWIGQMTLDNSVAVVGTLLITLAFLILGTELLQPRGLVPEEERVAEVLGRLLGDVWGPVGFWFMVAALFIGFWDTVLADQDGFARMFGNGTRLVLRRARPPQRWSGERFLRCLYLLVLLTLLPVGLYLAMGEPVGLLKIAGAIEAAHIPVVAGLTLYLNHRTLPGELRPSWPVWAATALAALFFGVFAVVHVAQLLRGGG